MEVASVSQNLPDRQLSGIPIVVGERPTAFWDFDHARTQAHFLQSIDPDYFTYLQQVHEAQLGSTKDLHAAVALRITYSHALESLFALIGAAVQAPHCPAGWLLRYQNVDLTWLIRKITDREPFHNRLNLDRAGWDTVIDRLFPWLLPEDAVVEHKASTVRLWRFLAKEYLDEHLQDEYNSLKHGLRVRSGGWHFAIGVEDQPGVPAPPERMRMMAQSDYGSSFLRPVWLKKYQYAIEEQRVNWSPADFLKRLPLIVDSINNVIVFLKYANEVPLEGVGVTTFTETTIGQALATESYSTSVRFSTRSRIPEQAINDVTAQQVLATYLGSDEAERDSDASVEEPSSPDNSSSQAQLARSAP